MDHMEVILCIWMQVFIALTVNERTVIDMVPEWFKDLFFIFMGILVICGMILAAVVTVGVIRMVIEEWKKGKK